MPRNKKQSKRDESLEKIASDNYEKVQNWPDWKQSISITSRSVISGQFISVKSKRRSA
ncbi:MAG: hypothetical protein AB7F70_12505 [Candidatus Omnitrophota bacterium]